jgi:hypothetical protein
VSVLWVTGGAADTGDDAAQTADTFALRGRQQLSVSRNALENQHLVLAVEGEPAHGGPVLTDGGVVTRYNLAEDEFLASWVARHGAAVAIGADAAAAARAVRAVAALRWARSHFDNYEMLIWVRPGTLFKGRPAARHARSWFKHDTGGCFYLQGDRTAPLDTAVGFRLTPEAVGNKLLDTLIDRYWTGRFKEWRDWSLGCQLDEALGEAGVNGGCLVLDGGTHSQLDSYLSDVWPGD